MKKRAATAHNRTKLKITDLLEKQAKTWCKHEKNETL
jgi:hypothetical protein